jgi:hypothetical protein
VWTKFEVLWHLWALTADQAAQPARLLRLVIAQEHRRTE